MNDERPDAADKTSIRHELDLRAAPWKRLRPEGNTLEYAFVLHNDGDTYTVLRQSSRPDGTVLVFTPSEWNAFLAGAQDGEFDQSH